MDVSATETLNEPYARILEALLAHSGTWLPGLARDASDRLITELGFGAGRTRISRRIAVEVAPPTVRPGRCEISVAWKAAEGSRLFPELGGVFELLAAGPARSTISFEASYDPPVRAIGRLVDHALLHRVAEACVQDFVARIAKELASQAE